MSLDLNKIYQGNCLELMESIDDDSIDAIVTDPPYELGFMGKSWDSTGIANDINLWQEALRVLKPGGYLLSFGGTRTYHRMACAIEDAGFEIRDMIEWIYGSGFPKSLDISKAIDKDNGKKTNLRSFTKWFDNVCKNNNLTNKQVDEYLGLNSNGATASHYRTVNGEQPRFPRLALYYKLKKWLSFGDKWDGIIEEAEREVIGQTTTNKTVYQNIGGKNESGEIDITIPSTPSAIQWQGWGTALKPAHEPICMARKPLSEKTVAENVLKYGTGGINIDATRIDAHISSCSNGDNKQEKLVRPPIQRTKEQAIFPLGKGRQDEPSGRFPANLIHDGSDVVMAEFEKYGNTGAHGGNDCGYDWANGGNKHQIIKKDSGTPARFFYCAKASKSERDMGCEELPLMQVNKMGSFGNQSNFDCPDGAHRVGDKGSSQLKNNHPTVKPIKLMEYLIKLVTTEKAIVLDPFAGSGSTLIACRNLGRSYIGIEKESDYVGIANKRIEEFTKQLTMVM